MLIYTMLQRLQSFLILSICLIAILALGCTNQEMGKETTFEQLFSNPDQYSGKDINLEGFVFLGFETMVISEELKYSGYTEGHLIPNGRMLWIEGGVPTDIYNGLFEQKMMGPAERYGKVLINGIFEYGEKYGHLGGFESQIIPQEIQLLDWSPT
jgi:hypothetical protein